MSDHIEDWLLKRNKTIDTLNAVIAEIEGTQKNFYHAKLWSNVGSVVSGLCNVTGGLTGVPRAIVTGLGYASSLTSLGSTYFEHHNISTALENAQKAMEEDCLEATTMNEKLEFEENLFEEICDEVEEEITEKVTNAYITTTFSKRKPNKTVMDGAKLRRTGEKFTANAIKYKVASLHYLSKDIYDLVNLVKTGTKSDNWLVQELRNIVAQLTAERDDILSNHMKKGNVG